MKPILHIGLVVITVMLCFPTVLFSQDTDERGKALTFFVKKAIEDAQYEQTIQLTYIEDEVDFWKDQRNFEIALKKQSYTAYQAYVNAKWEAYAGHKCDIHCTHSEQYYLQAAFYAQNGNKDLVISTPDAENATVQSDHPAVIKVDH